MKGSAGVVLLGALLGCLSAQGGKSTVLEGAAPATLAPPSHPAFGVVHEEGKLDSMPGTVLYTESWRGMGKPRGVLVVVPGLKDYARRYEALANVLVPRGIYVYSFDLRGHARSTGERVWVEHFDDYVRDLTAYIAFVRSREPGRPVFLLGHSMGGTIALAYALQHPELGGLVLSAPALQTNVSGLKAAFLSATASLFPHSRVLELDDAKFSRDPAVVAGMARDPLIDDGPVPALTAHELVTAMERLQKTQGGLAVPVLCLHGTQDEITPPVGSEALCGPASHLRIEDKTLNLYDGFFHDLLHEPGHERVSGDIAQWLVNRLPVSRR